MSKNDMVALPERKQWGGLLPTAENLRTEGWNACLDEIAKLGPLYSRPVQGEPACWAGKDALDGLAKASKGDWPSYAHILSHKSEFDGYTIPLYTHADPVEAERLRSELAETQRISHKEELRANRYSAQLAEAQALLREVHGGMWPSNPLTIKIGSHLSASAEPSAPKCGNCGSGTGQACNDKGCGYLESGNGEPSAPVEIDELKPCPFCGCQVALLTGREDYRIAGAHLKECPFLDLDVIVDSRAAWQARAALTSSAEPSAPVAQCTNEDSWNCKYCRNTESCEALKDPRNFGKPSAPGELLYQKCTVLKDSNVRYSNSTAPVEIDERAEITLEQVLQAYEYAEHHPHRYLRGTTNWCAAVAHSLNKQARAALELKS